MSAQTTFATMQCEQMTLSVMLVWVYVSDSRAEDACRAVCAVLDSGGIQTYVPWCTAALLAAGLCIGRQHPYVLTACIYALTGGCTNTRVTTAIPHCMAWEVVCEREEVAQLVAMSDEWCGGTNPTNGCDCSSKSWDVFSAC